MQTCTSREFHQYPSRIQKQARQEPVVISNRGKPDQVLMSYIAYKELIDTKKESVDTKPIRTIADAIGYSDASDIDFDPPRVEIGFRPVEF